MEKWTLIKDVVICFHSLNYWYLQQRLVDSYLNMKVVICFHSLNYWYLQQQYNHYDYQLVSCDLLSFFELLIFTTTFKQNTGMVVGLWFAFILWTTDIYNNLSYICFERCSVVICFHSLNYWYLQQHFRACFNLSLSCDLLSFFELLIFTTTIYRKYTRSR